MVSVIGTTGRLVNVNIIGMAEMIATIRARNLDIIENSDLNAAKGANLVAQEVQESIIGNRGEPRSVDTGRFANSIGVEKLANAEYLVFSNVEHSKFLEFGTSRIMARRHFRNTIQRNQDKIVGEITIGL